MSFNEWFGWLIYYAELLYQSDIDESDTNWLSFYIRKIEPMKTLELNWGEPNWTKNLNINHGSKNLTDNSQNYLM